MWSPPPIIAITASRGSSVATCTSVRLLVYLSSTPVVGTPESYTGQMYKELLAYLVSTPVTGFRNVVRTYLTRTEYIMHQERMR